MSSEWLLIASIIILPVCFYLASLSFAVGFVLMSTYLITVFKILLDIFRK